MIMPREKRVIQKEDIMSLDIYTQQRKELRKKIVEFKKIVESRSAHTLHFILKVLKQC